MTPEILLTLAIVLLALGVWEIVICEGAHLGRSVVIWLYDLTASRYDDIKSFDPDWERNFLGKSIASATPSMRASRILDLGAGTGRAARALLSLDAFRGTLACLEPSRGMLEVGRRKTAHTRVHWLQAWAVPLPFDDDTFDTVVCLEVLEFTPDPEATLTELVRVLRPGGWLLITNRVGRQASLILGRTYNRRRFPQALQRAGLEHIQVYPWQVEYDLAWARKP